MEHYVCRPTTHLPGYMQVNFLVPDKKVITAGQIYVQGDIAEEVGSDNFSVFTPQLIDDVENEIPCIILNGGFDGLNDKRKPAGNPDYTQYKFRQNEIATAIKLIPEIKFEISMDSIVADNEINVGCYLIPVAGSNKLMYIDGSYNILSEDENPLITENGNNIVREDIAGNILDINSSVYLKVEAIKDFRLGGLSGSKFSPTLIVRVIKNHIFSANRLKIQANITDNLEIPIEKGVTIGNLETIGGNEPYIYNFVNGGMDNDLFVLEGNIIKTKERITEARKYHVSVKVQDGEDNMKSSTIGFLIDNPSIKSLNITTTQDLREREPESMPSGLIATIEAEGGTPPYKLSLIGKDASLFKTDLMSIKTGEKMLERGEYTFIVRATDNKGKFLDKDIVITVDEPYPDIENVTISGEDDLYTPLPANTIVGHLSVIGGTIPYEITLPQGVGDNDLFILEDAIRTKEEIIIPGEKKIVVRVKDIHNKTKDGEIKLNIKSPDITEISFTPQTGLKEGNRNVDTNAIIGTFRTTGGTAPITYTIAGGDSAGFFRISANTLRVKGMPLTSGTYKILVGARDNYGKVYPTTLAISIDVIK